MKSGHAGGQYRCAAARHAGRGRHVAVPHTLGLACPGHQAACVAASSSTCRSCGLRSSKYCVMCNECSTRISSYQRRARVTDTEDPGFRSTAGHLRSWPPTLPVPTRPLLSIPIIETPRPFVLLGLRVSPLGVGPGLRSPPRRSALRFSDNDQLRRREARQVQSIRHRDVDVGKA
jgi:hypothetical protein